MKNLIYKHYLGDTRGLLGSHSVNCSPLSSSVYQYIFLSDGSHFSCDSLVYDTLLPKEVIEVSDCVINVW